MHNIAVFSFGRTQSARCQNKMLRPFADTTLVDIVGKLAGCEAPSFFAGYEPELEQKALAHPVPFIAHDQRSATIDGPIVDILSFLRPLDYEHFLCVNGCLPLLRLDTVVDVNRSALRDLEDRHWRSNPCAGREEAASPDRQCPDRRSSR